MDIGNLFSLSGRIGRKDYIIVSLILIAIGFAFSAASGFDDPSTIVLIIESVLSIALGIPNSFKRLHDTGKSGWWLLLALIPIVGWVALFIMTWLLPGQDGDNQYGSVNSGTPFPSVHRV